MKRMNLNVTGLKTLATLIVVVGVCTAASATSSEPSVSAQQVVDQFFPSRLHSVAAGYSAWALENSFSAFVVVEALPGGDPKTIVAAYSNGVGGAIRVIRAQPDGSYGLAFEPTGLDIGGTSVSMESLVIDESGLPTVKVSFGTVRVQTADWIFRWDGAQLVNLTPMETEEDGTKDTLLVLSGFVDLDHDGTLEIISTENYPPQVPEEGDPPAELPDAAWSIYRLTSSGYVLDRPVLCISEFFRKTATPTTETEEFPLLKNSAGPYVLKITNGNRDGSNRLSSGEIVLNGVLVVTSNMLNQQVEFLSIPVSLQPHNTLQVTLAAKPQGKLAITVEDTGPPPPAPPPQP